MKIVVPNNLRAAVYHPSRYNPEINQTYQQLFEHYGVEAIPASLARPRDKCPIVTGKVAMWTVVLLLELENENKPI